MSKKWIKDKNAKTFALVHRSHEDPEFYNEDAGEHVFVEVHKDQKKVNLRLQTKDDIEKELSTAISEGNIRKNEGEAALFGITYDDSKYDYMKHLRTIGTGEGVFIPSKPEPEKKKDEIIIRSPEELLEMPSKELLKYDYQRQQNVPDAISGFKPDINPDLREVLVALEDEDYLDAEYDVDDADIFDNLLNQKADDDTSGGFIEQEEVEDDWDIDNYEDDYAEYDSDGGNKEPQLYNENWEQDYKKFQNRKKNNQWDSDDEFDSDEDDEDLDEEARDTFGDLPNLSGLKTKSQKKKEKRSKGAKTDTSSYSMSSSALQRTEQLTIIDDKYDVMKEKYDLEDEDDYQPFDFKNERSDFEGMIDDFLDNYTLGKGGRKIIKKDPEAERLKEAADSVSKSKLAARRLKEKKGKSSVGGLTERMNNLRF